MFLRKKNRKKGFLLLEVILFLFILPVILYSLLSLVQIIVDSKEMQDKTTEDMKIATVIKNLIAMSNDVDGDGYKEVPGYSNNATEPRLPTQISAYFSVDKYGIQYRYCPYDNGPIVTGSNGFSTSSPCNSNSTITDSCIAFIIISAGRNKTFDNTCNDVYVRGYPVGDDVAYIIRHGNLR